MYAKFRHKILIAFTSNCCMSILVAAIFCLLQISLNIEYTSVSICSRYHIILYVCTYMFEFVFCFLHRVSHNIRYQFRLYIYFKQRFRKDFQRLGIRLRNREVPWFSTYKYLLRHITVLFRLIISE